MPKSSVAIDLRLRLLCLFLLVTRAHTSLGMSNGSEISKTQFAAVFKSMKLLADSSKGYCVGVMLDPSTVITSRFCNCPCQLSGEFSASGQAVNLEHVEEPVPAHPFEIAVYTLKGGKFAEWCKTADLIDDEDGFFGTELVNTRKAPGVVVGAEPSRAGAVLLMMDNTDCHDVYAAVQDDDWPDSLPDGAFCIFKGVSPLELGGTQVQAGLPCNDSAGSPVLLPDGKVIGIVVKAFCRDHVVAIGLAAYTLRESLRMPTPTDVRKEATTNSRESRQRVPLDGSRTLTDAAFRAAPNTWSFMWLPSSFLGIRVV